jgi:hypothetical protein
MFGIAAAGIAMLPAAVGVVAMAVALLALSVSVVALAGAIKALVDAAKAFESVGKTVKDLVGGLSGVLGGLSTALKGLCFRHATPMAETFNKTLQDTQGQAITAASTVEGLASSLRTVRATEAGVGGGATAGGSSGPQYITVSAPISVGNISAEIDLDRVTDSVSRGIANAFTRRMR